MVGAAIGKVHVAVRTAEQGGISHKTVVDNNAALWQVRQGCGLNRAKAISSVEVDGEQAETLRNVQRIYRSIGCDVLDFFGQRTIALRFQYHGLCNCGVCEQEHQGQQHGESHTVASVAEPKQ